MTILNVLTSRFSILVMTFSEMWPKSVMLYKTVLPNLYTHSDTTNIIAVGDLNLMF